MKTSNLSLIGLLTCVIIGVPSVNWELQRGGFHEPRGVAWVVCFLLYLCFYMCATRPLWNRVRPVAIALQSLLGLTCVALQPSGLQPILLVLVAAQLGMRSTRLAIAVTILQTIALAFIMNYRDPSEGPVTIALAYFAFQLFSVYTTHVAHAESVTSQALAQANAELKVTSGLLDISSRTSERLRIARDLHDLLGHHLTALTLNLEVASHLTDGKARAQVEKSRDIARTLLADVRDVVSRLRDDDPVDLGEALSALQQAINRPVIHLELPPDAAIRDSAVAQVALRTIQEIVTNAVRHSESRNLWVALSRREGRLQIDARDDGKGTDAVQYGNGLLGLRERVDQLHGELQITSAPGSGFALKVILPLEART